MGYHNTGSEIDLALRIASQPTRVNIQNAYKRGRKFTKQQNKTMLSHKKQNILQYLHSRSVYKQFQRMFIDGEVSRNVSMESKMEISDIKKANFDIMKLPNRARIIKSIYSDIQREVKKKGYNIEFSIYQIYFDLINVLSNQKLLNSIRSWYKKVEPLCKKEFSKNLTDEEKQSIYKCSFLISAYTNLIFALDHLTIMFGVAAVAGDLNPNDFFGQLQREQENTYKWVLGNIMYQSVSLIVYFQETDVNKLNKEINSYISSAASKEDWEEHRMEMYYAYGVESLALGILIAVGTALGLTLLLPTIRGLIYYWGCLKINISNHFKDESIYIAFNIKRLKEELERETDPQKRKKLQDVIAKQEVECEKLRQKAYKLALQYEEAAPQATQNMEVDQEVEEQEYQDNEVTPQILI